jgi:hypothetical protein
MCRHDLEYSKETCEMTDTVSTEEPAQKVLSDRLIDLADEVFDLEQSEDWYSRRMREEVADRKAEVNTLKAQLARQDRGGSQDEGRPPADV